jgi:hypothetical protein
MPNIRIADNQMILLADKCPNCPYPKFNERIFKLTLSELAYLRAQHEEHMDRIMALCLAYQNHETDLRLGVFEGLSMSVRILTDFNAPELRKCNTCGVKKVDHMW